jgi:hypothetical protein
MLWRTPQHDVSQVEDCVIFQYHGLGVYIIPESAGLLVLGLLLVVMLHVRDFAC